ncbi:NACHT, LRR and PYD domains-containing protein 3-like isoform X2 [Sardina pilchardus]|uniref:NACHT, LRR and PYD domains-containing protein 3-like isoform X2 n=1 Tax=Sardina pilchardus TaxID=27697 RepID=UPI002E0E5F32
MSEHGDCAGGGSQGDTSPTQKQKPNSPAPSCVSMKSHQSKDQDINFRVGESRPDASQTQKGRPDSPAPSCVSMKSDLSKDQDINFRGGDLSPVQAKRSCSPVPSCVSMKSDHFELKLEGRPDPGIQLEEETVNPSLSRCYENELSTIFKELEYKVITFMKNELKRLKKLLSPDYPESPCDEEEGEEDQRDARDGALKIAVHTLRSMKQDILAQQLELNGLLLRCQQQLKYRLSKKFESVFEGIPKQGNPTFLQKIYTELYITEGESVEVNTEHEIRQIEMASKRHITKGDTQIRCTEIFKPLAGQDKSIRTVLTKGLAGIGKTVSVQKFILDWTEGKANENILFIFPLPFRELNLIKDKTYTFEDIIHHFFCETKGVNFSNHNNYSIAFIFDGLDESRLSLDFQHNESIYSVTEHATVDVLLTNLIKGNLLPSALVWITSRPAAANQIPPECVDQVTEVRGFNDPQKEEYFRKRITEEELVNRIITHLKSSRILYVMCQIPVFCWMAATVLESILTEAESGEIPKSLTQMYTHFLIIQTKHRSQKYEKQDADPLWNLKTVLSLGKLAFQQLEKGNLIFYEEDLSECGIDVRDALVYSGVCTQIFREESGLFQGKVFCFVHLSIQEFLAALYVFLHFTMRERSTLDQHQKSQLHLLFSANSLFELHQSAVDLALRNENGQLDLFLRFLLGLSLESNQKLLQDLLPQKENISVSTDKSIKYIKQKIREATDPERCLNLFHCLNELNDHSLVEEVQSYVRKGDELRKDLSLSQLSALAFVLMMSEQELEDFNLQDYGRCSSPARSDAGLLRMLSVVKASRRVQLRCCNLTEDSGTALSSTLSSNRSNMRHLDLTYNNLGDSGVELLSTGLGHAKCELQILDLKSCNLKKKSCAALSSALRTNSNLKQLDLSGNNLGDSGVEQISSGLTHKCRLEKLVLSGCKLTERSCAALSSALSSESSSLTQLHLRGNYLGDSGMELLSAGLTHPNCRLETLELRGCSLTEKSCAAVAGALSSNSSRLRQLNLSYNDLGDSGVELLSTGLGNPHCELEKLELQYCKLTGGSCSSLAVALRSNRSSLRELNLRLNFLEQCDVELLSILLKDPTYKLSELQYINNPSF